MFLCFLSKSSNPEFLGAFYSTSRPSQQHKHRIIKHRRDYHVDHGKISVGGRASSKSRPPTCIRCACHGPNVLEKNVESLFYVAGWWVTDARQAWKTERSMAIWNKPGPCMLTNIAYPWLMPDLRSGKSTCRHSAPLWFDSIILDILPLPIFITMPNHVLIKKNPYFNAFSVVILFCFAQWTEGAACFH
jgi:hypothetical protein